MPRFTIQRMMGAMAGLAVVLAFFATYHQKLGCGYRSVPLSFNVVDDGTGQPIVGARIDLIIDYGLPPAAVAVTGSRGGTNLVCNAGCTSYIGPFLSSYRTYWFTQAARISAPGYQAEERMLRDFMKPPIHGGHWAPNDPVEVRMKPSHPTPAH